MKQTSKMWGVMQSIAIIAFVAVIGSSMAACDNPSSPSRPARVLRKIFRSVYAYSSNLDIYELVIDSESPATGDAYTLNVYDKEGNSKGKSSGTITVSGGTYTLSNGGTVTISSDSMTAITGSINKDGGGTLTTPSKLVAVKDGGNGSLNGTWKKEDMTVTFNGSNFTYRGEGITAPGTACYSASPGILVTAGTMYGDYWIVAGNYELKSGPIRITFTGFSGTYGAFYSGDWNKQ